MRGSIYNGLDMAKLGTWGLRTRQEGDAAMEVLLEDDTRVQWNGENMEQQNNYVESVEPELEG